MRGVLAILGGTAIGQIVTLFALPVLARIYDPDEYGLLAVAMSAAAIIAPLATMRLEGAVVLAGSRSEVSALIQAALVSLATTSTCLAAVIALSGLQQRVSIDGRTTLMWGLPLLVFRCRVCDALQPARGPRQGVLENRYAQHRAVACHHGRAVRVRPPAWDPWIQRTDRWVGDR